MENHPDPEILNRIIADAFTEGDSHDKSLKEPKKRSELLKPRKKRELNEKQKEAFAQGRAKAQDSLKKMRELNKQKILLNETVELNEYPAPNNPNEPEELITVKPKRGSSRRTKAEKLKEKYDEEILMKEYELKKMELDKKINKAQKKRQPKEKPIKPTVMHSSPDESAREIRLPPKEKPNVPVPPPQPMPQQQPHSFQMNQPVPSGNLPKPKYRFFLDPS